jgi:hypothetical protein
MGVASFQAGAGRRHINTILLMGKLDGLGEDRQPSHLIGYFLLNSTAG